MFALRVVTRTDGVPAPTRNDRCATPRRRGAYLPLLVALGLMPVRLGAQESSPDLIVTDAKVFTADSTRLWAEAFAVRRDRIIAVGTTIEMRALAGARTRRVNAGGRVVIPGINDAHVHLGEGSLGLTFGTRDTTPAGPTLQEVLDSLRQIAPRTPKGTWLQASLGQRILFDPLARRAALDVVSPDHPVLLRAPWGHGIVVNSAALRALGIADTASDLLGGRYERDADRRLTGMLVEYDGWAPIQRAQARQRQRDAVAAVRRDVLGRLEFGVTSVQDMASTWDAPSTQRILREAALPVRVRVVRWPMPGAGGRQLRRWSDLPVQVAPMVSVSGVKYVLEGTPQDRRGAAHDDGIPRARFRLAYEAGALRACESAHRAARCAGARLGHHRRPTAVECRLPHLAHGRHPRGVRLGRSTQSVHRFRRCRHHVQSTSRSHLP